MFAGFQPSAFQNNAFQTGSVFPPLAGGGGGAGKRVRIPGEKKRKSKRAYYVVDDKVFTSAADAAAYVASLQPVIEPATEAAPIVKQETVLSSVQIGDKELAVETIIPVRATKEFVADLIRAEMEKAQLQLRLEAEREEQEELKVVSMILSMMFGDDVIIEMNTAPPTVHLVS
jgi:hypothetical protein